MKNLNRKLIECVAQYVAKYNYENDIFYIWTFKNNKNNIKYYIQADYLNVSYELNKYTSSGAIKGYKNLNECENVLRKLHII